MMWGVFAELEHDIIVQRVKSGMRNAIAKGKKIGRPKVTADNIPQSFTSIIRDSVQERLICLSLRGCVVCRE